MYSLLIVITLTMVTIAAGFILIYPFRRGAKLAGGGSRVELAIYRSQLDELERDRLVGLLSAEQADYIRAEIARRLFASSDDSSLRSHRPNSHPWTVASILGFLGAAIVLYLSIGRPDLPSHPFKSQASSRGIDTAEHAIAKQVDGGSAMMLGANPARLDGLAETLMEVAGGTVTEDARKIFEQSLSIEPNNPRARFYVALSLEQSGKTADARAAFEALAKQSPADAPWVPLVNEHIAMNGGTANLPGARPSTQTDPAINDIAAKGTISGGGDQLIRRMVESLDAKLAANPSNFEGWMRLVRSYAVLNDKDHAEGALKRGLAAFPATGAEGRQLLALARDLGIEKEMTK